MRKIHIEKRVLGLASLLASWLVSQAAWAGTGPGGAGSTLDTPVPTGGGLGSLMNNLANEITNTNVLLSTIAYVIAGGLVISSIPKFKVFIDGQGSLADALWRFGGAGLMGAAPTVVNMIMTSLGFDTTSTQRTTVIGGGGTGGLDTLMVNFVSDIYLPAKLLMKSLCYIGGIIFSLIAIRRLAESGQAAAGRAPKVSGTTGYFIAGALLLSLGPMMDSVASSIFGQANPGSFSALAFVPQGISSTQANNVFSALFSFVELIGWIAFIRGILVLRGISEGQSNRTPTQAFIFLIAGAIAVNMYGFIKAVQTTLGISMVS